MSHNVISIKQLFHSYDTEKTSVQALKGLDLQVGKGEIFGFLGPNGAGKTTTIKLLLGILRVQKGELSVLGKDPFIPSTRSGIGYMPEVADYYPYITPKELLLFYSDIFGMARRTASKRADELLELVGLENERNRLIKTFSKGMKQKVSFAQALINDPELLILDEPTSGLDPLARKQMREKILSLRSQGRTVFFSSHELSEVELISDRVSIIHKGRLLQEGNLHELARAQGEGKSLENYFLALIEKEGR